MRNSKRLTLILASMAMAIMLAAGGAMAATIVAGNADNNFSGTADDDYLDGAGGNDRIQGMAGNDELRGGDGADRLFGGDEAQNYLQGNDTIYGQLGNDEVVGGDGVDILNGGPGNDTIFDGPGNDTADDRMVGGDGDDNMQSTNLPAAKDTVSCGSGIDEVQADALDAVAADCENVEIYEGDASGATSQDTGGDPLYLPSGTEPEGSGTDEPLPTEPGATPQEYRYYNFKCNAPPANKRMRWCALIDPRVGWDVGVGVYQTSEPRWVYVEARVNGNKQGGAMIHKDHDAHDWMYTSNQGDAGSLYARTSKQRVQKWWKWTFMDAYKDFRR